MAISKAMLKDIIGIMDLIEKDPGRSLSIIPVCYKQGNDPMRFWTDPTKYQAVPTQLLADPVEYLLADPVEYLDQRPEWHEGFDASDAEKILLGARSESKKATPLLEEDTAEEDTAQPSIGMEKYQDTSGRGVGIVIKIQTGDRPLDIGDIGMLMVSISNYYRRFCRERGVPNNQNRVVLRTIRPGCVELLLSIMQNSTVAMEFVNELFVLLKNLFEIGVLLYLAGKTFVRRK